MTGLQGTGASGPLACASVDATDSGELGGGPDRLELRRAGAKPLRFTGVRMAQAEVAPGGGVPGYMARLYRISPAGCVVELLPSPSATASGAPRAWRTADRAAALARLRDHDPASDVVCRIDPDDPALSRAEVAAHLLDLRARVGAARRVLARLADMLEADAERRT
jgi:hypothetical protein